METEYKSFDEVQLGDVVRLKTGEDFYFIVQKVGNKEEGTFVLIKSDGILLENPVYWRALILIRAGT